MPGSEHECPVCLEDMQDPVAKLACGHRFCDDCIRTSIHMVANSVPSCPICRCPIREYHRQPHADPENSDSTLVLVVTSPHAHEVLMRGTPRPSASQWQRVCWWMLMGTSIFMFLFISLHPGHALNHCHMADTSGSAVCSYGTPEPPNAIRHFCFASNNVDEPTEANANPAGYSDTRAPLANGSPMPYYLPPATVYNLPA